MTAGRNPLIFIFVTRLIDAIGFGIVMPVLPQLLIHLGEPNVAAADRTAGFLLITYSVLQFFCGPIVGNLSDRFGRRPVILASLYAFAVDFAVMGFAPSIGWLFVGRAIAGMAGAVYVPANAYVADVTAPADRARSFGFVGAAFGVGFVLGPAIGGLLGQLGPRAPFFAAAALAAVNFLFGIIVLPESLPKERRRAFDWKRANPFGAILRLRRFPHVLFYALAMVVFLVANNVYPSTWSFFMTAKFNWPPGWIGGSLAATGIAMALVQMGLIGRVVAKVGEMGSALLGLGAATIACVAYALASAPWMIFAIIAPGALQALAYPSLNALMSRAMPADEQGELQGSVASLGGLANIFGPLAMTQTFAYFAAPNTPIYFPGAAFVLAGALNLVGAALLLSQRPRSHLPEGMAVQAE
jgi:DHA1 family tetracycline resistance protein-like MFS transporter